MANRTNQVKSEGQKRAETIRAEFPEVYWTPGIGWCGPQWELAQTRERELAEGGAK